MDTPRRWCNSSLTWILLRDQDVTNKSEDEWIALFYSLGLGVVHEQEGCDCSRESVRNALTTAFDLGLTPAC